MNVYFRLMQPDDVAQIAQLEKEIFTDAWSFEQFMSETDGQFFKYPFIVNVDNQLAGYTCIWAFSDEVHINNFAIHPDFRRKGLGLKLISYIFDTFNAYKSFFLEVRVSNKAAIGLYKKSGFIEYFIRKKYYSDGEDAVVMKKTL